jgi:hypothetical protein
LDQVNDENNVQARIASRQPPDASRQPLFKYKQSIILK